MAQKIKHETSRTTLCMLSSLTVQTECVDWFQQTQSHHCGLQNIKNKWTDLQWFHEYSNLEGKQTVFLQWAATVRQSLKLFLRCRVPALLVLYAHCSAILPSYLSHRWRASYVATMFHSRVTSARTAIRMEAEMCHVLILSNFGSSFKYLPQPPFFSFLDCGFLVRFLTCTQIFKTFAFNSRCFASRLSY